MTVQIYLYLQNHPTFHSDERLVNLVRRSALLVYLYLVVYDEYSVVIALSFQQYVNRALKYCLAN